MAPTGDLVCSDYIQLVNITDGLFSKAEILTVFTSIASYIVAA
jgi:hypothetical protein